MSSDVLGQLLAAIEALPPSVNPYTFTLGTLKDNIVPPVPAFFLVQSYVAAGLASVGIICSIATLVIKSRTKSLWIIRMKPTKSGTLLLPNATMTLLIFSLAYCILNLVSLPLALEAYKHGGSPVPYQWIQTVLWLPILLCIHAACHSQVSSLYLNLTNSNARSKTVSLVSKLVPRRLQPAFLINLVFVSGYVLIISASVPLFAVSAQSQDASWSIYNELVELARPAAEAWTAGASFQLDPAFLPPVLEMVEQSTRSTVYVGRAFLTYTVFQIASLVVYVPATLIYIKSLAQQMKVQRDLPTESDWSSEKSRSIHSTYRLMVCEAILVLGFEIVFTAVSCCLAFRPMEILSSGLWTAIIIGFVLYSFGISSTALAFVFFLKALQPSLVAARIRLKRETMQHTSANLVSAIAVEIVTQRFTEGLVSDAAATTLSSYRKSGNRAAAVANPQAPFSVIRLKDSQLDHDLKDDDKEEDVYCVL